MQRESDVYWLALRAVDGVGPRTARLLLEHYGSADAIFAASEAELVQLGIPRKTALNILGFDRFAPLERELCELERIGARLVRWSDEDYPPNLREIPDPPPFFYLRGNVQSVLRDCIAVVGARTASDAGLRMARRLGRELAAKGLTVVSGLARGIDGEAHQGALEVSGSTVAVMACGIDVIYPPEHRKLAEAIVKSDGALIAELPLGTPPIAENFPVRNRILSGLSLGVVVVEASERSGSLITARLALEQNRQVFAVPGSPLTGKTRGSNRLLKEGARLVECVEDVIEELSPQLQGQISKGAVRQSDAANKGTPATSVRISSKERPNPAEENLTKDAKSILKVLKDGQRLHVDAIIEASQLDAQTVLRLLLEMELHGIVAQHPGKLFSLA